MKTLLTIIIGLLSIALFAQNEVSDTYKANGKFVTGFHNNSVIYKVEVQDSLSMTKFNELVEYVNQLRLEAEAITSFFVQFTQERAGTNVPVPRLVIYYNSGNDFLIVNNVDLTEVELSKIAFVKTESEMLLNP